jgi:hypothetical protein
MNKLFFFLLVVALVSCKKDDTGPVIETVTDYELDFGGSGDDRGRSAVVTPLNHVLIAGTYQTETNYTDLYLVEIDINGNFIRDKRFGSALDDVAGCLIKGNDENYLLGGTTTTSSGTKDMVVYKVNAEGDSIWQKTYGGTNNEDLAHIKATGNGYLITGFTESYGTGSRDAWLILIDENGNEVWAKTFGGIGRDGGSKITIADDGNYLLFGYTESIGAGDRDFYLLKINQNGSIMWQKTYGSSAYEETYDIIPVASGGYLLFGHSAGIDINHDMYAVKINDDGDQIYGEIYGGNAHDGGEAVLQSSNGEFVHIGSSNSFGNAEQVYMVKTDNSGEIISEYNYGGASDDAAVCILETSLSYLIIGESKTSGNYQMLVKKIAK